MECCCSGTIRSRAAEWCIDPDRIGVMGFSAGGYPAAHASMHSGVGDASAADHVDRYSSRPNFQALIYPHMLGCQPSTGDPPAFLMASYYDGEGT
jgi:acetyl esterase/lipase